MIKNTMSIGGKQLHATTKFMRQFKSVKAKLANHKDAAFKKAEKSSHRALKILDEKKLLTKSWTKLKKQPNMERIYSNKQVDAVVERTRKEENTVHVATLMDTCDVLFSAWRKVLRCKKV